MMQTKVNTDGMLVYSIRSDRIIYSSIENFLKLINLKRIQQAK